MPKSSAESTAVNGKKNRNSDRNREYIRQMIDPYMDESGFITYENSVDLRKDLESYINDVVRGDLLTRSRYRDAFDVTSIIMEEICQLSIDDAGSITETLMYRCKDIISHILKKGGTDLKHDIFDWLCGIVELEEKEYIDDQIKSLWLKNFNDRDYLQHKLDIAQRKVESCAGDCRNLREERPEGLAEWLGAFFEIAASLRLNDEEIMPVAERFRDLPEVRDCMATRYLDSGRAEEAVKVLRAGIELDADEPGRAASYSRRIADICEEAGDRRGMAEELKAVVLRYDRCSLEDFRRLKACYSRDAWKDIRDEILEELEGEPGIGRLYCEEEIYEKLMEFVAADGSIEVLDEFRDVLKNRYREEMMALYEKIVREKLAHATSKKHYRSMVSVMRKMKDIPGGDVVIEDLDTEFRRRYPNRMGMMNELDILYREKIKKGGIIL